MIRKYIYASLAILIISCPLFAGTEYFISTDGSDTNPGTQERPFATLQRASSAIRELKKSEDLPKGGVTVWIRAGTYYVNEPLTLSDEDSGAETAPIVYRGQTGQQVRIVGGRRAKGFQPVTDPDILERLDESVRAKVVFSNLKAEDITDFGEVATRSNRLELFFRDEPMQLARWPNEGFLRIVDVVGKTPNTIHGIKGTREGKFTYSDDRPKRWADEQEIWLHGYWFWDWSDSFEKVSSIDTEKRIIETAPPFHNYGYRKGQRYYALNVLAELDRPGEWYLDRRKGLLYFLPPLPIDDGKAVLSTLRNLFELKDCSWVTIRDLVLEATRSTAVTVSGGTGNTIAGCTIRNTGGWAVSISGGSNNSVLGCDIYRTAEGGVSLSGGERKSLTPAGHRAENNHIHHFGRIYRTYRPAVSVGGVGNHVAHNVIHDGPHNAIQLGGNDHTIEFNEIYNVCFETGDVGAFYMGRDWTARGTIIRHNYFHDIKGPGLHGAMAVYLDDAASGISIIGNIFHRAGRAAFIGGGRDNLVENNIFVDCEASVHVDARGVGWMKYHVEAGGTLPERLKATPYKQPPWSEKYPQLVNILDDSPGEPKGNMVRRNISFGGKWLDVESKAMPLIKFEDNLVDKDPHFVNAEHKDFRLRPDSPAFAMGFKQIPAEKIGLYNDGYRTKNAPYPPSKVITEFTWSPEIVKMEDCISGDNWPVAWVSNSLQITAFCDGRGFSKQAPDLSLGFAKVFGDPPDFSAENFESDADTPMGGGSSGIKASDMLAIDGILYMFVRNYKPAGSDDFTNSRLACSTDLGESWTWADWHFSETFGCPAFVQFGMNYQRARDDYVYIASQANDSAYGYSPDIALARVRKDRLMERSRYEFFAGLDGSGGPLWSPDISKRKPVFTNPKGTQRIAITYNAALGRYILATSHLTGGKATHTAALGVFEAPEPWGPWATLYYNDHWSVEDGKDCRTYHHRFPPKWISPDGRTMWLLYSGLDCGLYTFCVKKATLEIAPSQADVTGTFSIVAVDPETGVCGAAVASKYPAVGKVVPYVRAGVGAFCTQHWHNPDWGQLALDMLAKGSLPEQVLTELLRDDTDRDKRQLAIIDMSGRAANRNPAKADPSGTWWGAASGKYYACQGNTLTGREVVFEMAKAYEQTEGSLADRLMAALIAGDIAGGDHRGRLAAGIRVAKKGVDGCWLELYVDKSDDAVIDLAKKYAALDHEAKGAWRGGRLPFENPSTGKTEPLTNSEK
jgi:uncharacterized Ntn-hydrolase superfamily protein